MRWLTNLYDFRFKWTAKKEIGIHPTKSWLSQLVNCKNAIWTLEEWYAIKLCFILGKNATETYGMLQTAFEASCLNRASVFEWHSRKAVSLWWMMKGVGGVRKSTDKGWLAKVLGLGLLCWGFKGVQEEIPWEEASTLEIGSVAFPPGLCTSPQLHPCHVLFDEGGNQDSSSASLWKGLWRRSLTHSHKTTSMGRCRSSRNGTTNALQPEKVTLKGTRVSCAYYQ